MNKSFARINALAKKSREEGLTEEEKAEQAVLRREYIDGFKRSLVGQLENTYIVEPDGTKRKVQKKDEKFLKNSKLNGLDYVLIEDKYDINFNL